MEFDPHFAIDRERIPPPQIEFSAESERQLGLLRENDYTLKDQHLRLQITGKECHGFTYSVGFTPVDEEDFILSTPIPQLSLLMDPFTAYYCQRGRLDFELDPESGEDGFLFLNHQQDQFKGKFWRDKEHLVPPSQA